MKTSVIALQASADAAPSEPAAEHDAAAAADHRHAWLAMAETALLLLLPLVLAAAVYLLLGAVCCSR
jgi:hypothetical protein